ncbi:hypothetical protein [Legionella sp. W05-934-2]|uniref:hypothetical protein n=1 Tax=Legionella sp. W05-934-2 TaxID=1198649 RepID=UPI003461EA6F
MKKKLLITARDVGAAINIIEIVKYAHSLKNIELHLYVQNPAAKYFANANIAINPVLLNISHSPTDADGLLLLNYADKLIKEISPDVILCGLSTPGDGGIDEAIIFAAKNKIPTFVMQDFWGEVNDFFGHCADFYLCLSDHAKFLSEQKYNCEGIVIGSPRHAWYGDADLFSKKLSLRHQYDLGHDDEVIGLFGQSLHHIPGYSRTILNFLNSLNHKKDELVLLYRPHPRETESQRQKSIAMLEESNLTYVITENDKVEHSLLMSDVVVSILSNCLYDSCYLNFFSEVPLITPVALCYEEDLLRHLNNFSMISSSPYKSHNLAKIYDESAPDAKTIDYLLSEDCKRELWLSSKKLQNPKLSAKKAIDSLLSHC